MFEYNAKLDRVIDADTLVLEVDLGFNIWTRQTIRIGKIDAPEMRGEERVEGLAATRRVKELMSPGDKLILLSEKEQGSFGRKDERRLRRPRSAAQGPLTDHAHVH